MLEDGLVLDAAMTAAAALYRLAQHGYWMHPGKPEAQRWLNGYVSKIKTLSEKSDKATKGRKLKSDPKQGLQPRPRPEELTSDAAARMLTRSPKGKWAVIRRQDGVTIFWYARQLEEVLYRLSNAPGDANLLHALDLHETTVTPVIPSDDLEQRPSDLAVILHGNDVLGVRGPIPSRPNVRVRGGFESGLENVVTSKSVGREETSAEVVLRAYPLLQAPTVVAVGDKFDLEIGLSETPVAKVTSTGQLLMRAPGGTATIQLDVQVVADGFDAPKEWKRTLKVSVAEPTKARVNVRLVALPQQEPVRLSKLVVHFAINGVGCGTASVNIAVTNARGSAPPPPDPRGLSWLGGDGSPPPLVLGETALKPDIELDISKPDGNAARGNYRCVIRNAHGVPVPTSSALIELGEDAGTFAKALIDQVSQWSGDPLVAVLLGNIGKTVADKLPLEFWNVLQGVSRVVKDRPITLQLNSAEPYVPWELALVEPAIDPTRPPFLAAQVAMGRWILGDRSVALPPAVARNVQAMAIMAGVYKTEAGLRPLPEAIEEAKSLAKSYEAMPAVPLDNTAANFKDLLDATLVYNFSPIGGVQCVHFAGHGETDPSRPGDAAIYLTDGRPITPLFFNGSTLGRKHNPFIFLNACMVGTGGEMLGGYGGFPGNCLAGGYCGLVAPLWAVNDSVAKSIAIDFYDQIFSPANNRSVADVLRDMRAKYDSTQPVVSYLAYVYYGNPNLKLTRSTPATP